ncbi:RNAse H-fold protein YqgF [Prevotella dentalis DSM 3688]|uniref:Putative pre-16S rRNA nuclease n=1 Tax=Prevotella dentalis (strain ATCC 49559 / DSM 3688 / JCM 13448 / NCTC 12043 / ES 2772) TaxID=908937 RepID=F9D4W2_PREDD|nr:RNAse H-fold protein YqgF [Prevotella dentalis DSM 3688]EGQ13622.1 Holliday junction resolvase [Prevotella dentalis DSM 3688]
MGRDNDKTFAYLARILSIDYGKKRTGLAVTDPLQLIANGLTTVETKDLFDFLSQYVVREEVEQIVIGKPMQTSGQPSENLARVENFVGRWRNAHPAIPIDYYDERFTSVLAHRAMIEGGVKKKARRENKGLVDEISATIILQDYMNSRK